MKNLLFFLITCCIVQLSSAQYMRITNDSVLMKGANGTELILENATKGKTGGFLKNKVNGRTEFAYAIDTSFIRNDTIFFHRGDGWKTMKIAKYNEADPAFLAHVASSITSTNVSNWNTAFNRTFSNGVTLSSNNLKLGGSLTNATQLDMYGYSFTLQSFTGFWKWDGERVIFQQSTNNANQLIGVDAAYNNPGSNLKAWGTSALIDGSGNNKIAIGTRSFRQHKGSNGIAIGDYTGQNTNGDNNNVLGQSGGSYSYFSNSNLFGTGVSAGNIIDSITLNNSNIIVVGSTSSSLKGVQPMLTRLGWGTTHESSFYVTFSGTPPLVNDGLGRRTFYLEKGRVTGNDTLLLEMGKFLDQGSGTFTVYAYEPVSNVVAVGDTVHADRSNQAVVGNELTQQFKTGKYRVNTILPPSDGQVYAYNSTYNELRPVNPSSLTDTSHFVNTNKNQTLFGNYTFNADTYFNTAPAFRNNLYFDKGATASQTIQSNATGFRINTLPDKTGTFAMLDDITKTQVGLGNVDNTSDVNKPVSTAQQTSLNLKLNTTDSTLYSTKANATKVRDSLQANINLKANVASPFFTGTVQTPILTVNAAGNTNPLRIVGNVDNGTVNIQVENNSTGTSAFSYVSLKAGNRQGNISQYPETHSTTPSLLQINAPSSGGDIGFQTAGARKMTLNQSGSLGLGTGTAAIPASLILQLTSTTQGFAPPRMSTAQRDAIVTTGLVDGVLIYNTTTNTIDIFKTPGGVGSWYQLIKTQVTTTAGLRTLPVISADIVYQTADFGGGMWYYDASDATTSDNTGTVVVNGTKRLKRIFSGHVNPVWFGAIADGTTDNTTAFQNAINTGYTVKTLGNGGKYIVKELIPFRTGQNFDFTGDTLKLKSGTFGVIFRSTVASTGNSIRITGGVFDCNKTQITASDGNNTGGFSFENCDDVSISNVEVINSAAFGIKGYGVNNMMVNNCIVRNCGNNPIYIHAADGIYNYGNTVVDCKIYMIGNGGTGIYLYGNNGGVNSKFTVSRNYVRGPLSGTIADRDFCMTIHGVDGIISDNNTRFGDAALSADNVSRSIITGNRFDSVSTAGDGYCLELNNFTNVVTGNYFGRGKYGIIFSSRFTNSAIGHNNLISGNTFEDQAVYALFIQASNTSARNINITGNTFLKNTASFWNAIRLGGDCKYAVIANNIIKGGGENVIQSRGIFLDSVNSFVTIRGNQISGVEYPVSLYNNVGIPYTNISFVGNDMSNCSIPESSWLITEGTASMGNYILQTGNISNTGKSVDYVDRTNNTLEKWGTGTPEGVVIAGKGSVFHRTDGGIGTSYYVKESGTGNTGWLAK